MLKQAVDTKGFTSPEALCEKQYQAAKKRAIEMLQSGEPMALFVLEYERPAMGLRDKHNNWSGVAALHVRLFPKVEKKDLIINKKNGCVWIKDTCPSLKQAVSISSDDDNPPSVRESELSLADIPAGYFGNACSIIFSVVPRKDTDLQAWVLGVFDPIAERMINETAKYEKYPINADLLQPSLAELQQQCLNFVTK